MNETKNCHDCGARIGDIHTDGCDVERCPRCDGQLISCGCADDGWWPPDDERERWSGVMYEKEQRIAVEDGHYTKWVQDLIGPHGTWESCTKDDPEGEPDLNYGASVLRGSARIKLN